MVWILLGIFSIFSVHAHASFGDRTTREVPKQFQTIFLFSFPYRASNPNITAWMQKMGYGQNYSLLEQHYEQKYVEPHTKDVTG